MDIGDIVQLQTLLKEIAFALGILGVVATCNIYSFAWISLAYHKTFAKGVTHGMHYEMFRFVGYILLLMVSMLLSLSVWVVALVYFNFAQDWISALLFTMGFFTTSGSHILNLPVGWRFIPSIIAFSGLFSFAWATGASIGMFNCLSRHLEKLKIR